MSLLPNILRCFSLESWGSWTPGRDSSESHIVLQIVYGFDCSKCFVMENWEYSFCYFLKSFKVYLYGLLFLSLWSNMKQLKGEETRCDSQFELTLILLGKAWQQELPTSRTEMAACSQFSRPGSMLTLNWLSLHAPPQPLSTGGCLPHSNEGFCRMWRL